MVPVADHLRNRFLQLFPTDIGRGIVNRISPEDQKGFDLAGSDRVSELLDTGSYADVVGEGLAQVITQTCDSIPPVE